MTKRIKKILDESIQGLFDGFLNVISIIIGIIILLLLLNNNHKDYTVLFFSILAFTLTLSIISFTISGFLEKKKINNHFFSIGISLVSSAICLFITFLLLFFISLVENEDTFGYTFIFILLIIFLVFGTLLFSLSIIRFLFNFHIINEIIKLLKIK